MSNKVVIEATHIRKVYGATVAVDDVSFQVFEGEIFGLIGPNGAGKTTSMECIEGVREIDSGCVSVLSLNPWKDALKLQNRIGVQLQQAQLQKRIKVWEAMDLWASLYEHPIDAELLLEQLGLADNRHRVVYGDRPTGFCNDFHRLEQRAVVGRDHLHLPRRRNPETPSGHSPTSPNHFGGPRARQATADCGHPLLVGARR